MRRAITLRTAMRNRLMIESGPGVDSLKTIRYWARFRVVKRVRGPVEMATAVPDSAIKNRIQRAGAKKNAGWVIAEVRRQL